MSQSKHELVSWNRFLTWYSARCKHIYYKEVFGRWGGTYYGKW